ncbi:ester cyclase [Mycobacterium avium subsp. paratuberculosis]|nr:ester cyclase [Mycobacterium avium subsp. paratuberculosis]
MSDTKTVALESFRLIENGDVELAEKIIASDFVNQEADDDPEEVERQQHGAAGFLATSQWLCNAFSNLSFEHQETLAEGNTVIAVSTMTGEHTGIFNGIQPTGKHIEHKQVHIFTITDGQITHHRAIRDDLGLLLQLGWRPGGVA